MIVSIEMGEDLSAGRNAKIFILSPSYKTYHLDAYTETYRTKKSRVVYDKDVPLMSLNAIADTVQPENGEFMVKARIEMFDGRYTLESDKITMTFQNGALRRVKTIGEILKEYIKANKVPEGTGNTVVMWE